MISGELSIVLTLNVKRAEANWASDTDFASKLLLQSVTSCYVLCQNLSIFGRFSRNIFETGNEQNKESREPSFQKADLSNEELRITYLFLLVLMTLVLLRTSWTKITRQVPSTNRGWSLPQSIGIIITKALKQSTVHKHPPVKGTFHKLHISAWLPKWHC